MTEISEISSADIRQILGQHDSDIKGMGREIGALKSDVKSLDTTVNAGFTEVRNLLTEAKAKQGPGLMQIVYGGAACAAVLGGIATAITMLVQSSVSPQIAKIETTVLSLERRTQAQDDQDAADLQRLKAMRAAEVTDTLKTLKQSLDDIRMSPSNSPWGSVTVRDYRKGGS